jgi:NADPH:quinone reductase-like Zn-dependent oxidoreductase
VVGKQRIGIVGDSLEHPALSLGADVAESDERVPLQVAPVVLRDEEAVVTAGELVRFQFEPLDERDGRLGLRGERVVRPPPLDPPVPGADVLADVAAVDLVTELASIVLGGGARRLCPVREALGRVERPWLVERAGRTGVDAEAARAAVEPERRRRLELLLGHERSEDDPRAVAARDQHRVLAVEAHARAGGRLPVDMLVLVHEHEVLAAEPPPEEVELLAELGVVVAPGVARQAALARARARRRAVVAESGRDDRAGAWEQVLGMTGDVRPRHRETHIGEQAARFALADVSLGVLVGLGCSGPDDVDAELSGDPIQFSGGQVARIVGAVRSPPVKAVRIHEDGGPEVLRYEDAPEPSPQAGEVLIRLRAASLNRLDVWVRQGRPSVPKPRILGADGAGVVEALGAGVDGLAEGQAVLINPGLEHDSRITVVGEHTDGTHAELIAVPATNVYPLPEGLGFEEAAAFPLVFETAYRMLVTKGRLEAGEWVLVWGVGGGVATAALQIAKALGAHTIATSSSEEKLAHARELGADAALNHASSDVPQAVKELTGGPGADLVVEHVGEATWQASLQAVRPQGRITVCGATSGPNPPASLHRIWWKELSIYGSTMGTKADFEGAYELVATGRAQPIVDSVFPLSETRAAHERMEAGHQMGKIVLRIPE